jgi:hypothetical protein
LAPRKSSRELWADGSDRRTGCGSRRSTMAQTCWIQDRKSLPDHVSRVTRFSAWSIQVEYTSLGRSPHDYHPLSEGCLSSSYTCNHSLPPFLPLARYEIFSAFFRFLPYSGQEWDETIPPMPAQHPFGWASRFPMSHPMSFCLFP